MTDILHESSTGEKRVERLREILRGMDRVMVAFSGGLDSGFLAKIAHEELGDRVLAVTGISASVPLREQTEARRFAEEHAIPHRFLNTDEVEDARYAANPINRCFFCKDELYGKLRKLAEEQKFDHILDGTNRSDVGDHRPGHQAAGKAGVRSLLLEAGLTKEDIREAAHRMNLSIWDKPSFACLASRFPYGENITPEKLKQVEEAETVLWEKGFRQFRVRYHGVVARIEVEPGDRLRLVELGGEITEALRGLGFRFVAMDLVGYRTGSMNEGVRHSASPASNMVSAPYAPSEEPEETKKPRKTSRRKPRKVDWTPKPPREGWHSAFVDGASRGNPGRAAIAGVLLDDRNEEVLRFQEAIGTATNNEAEYPALHRMLREASPKGVKRIQIYSDSELVVKQVSGEYRVKNANLLRIVSEVQKSRKRFASFAISAIPRGENKLADHLANRALDEQG